MATRAARARWLVGLSALGFLGTAVLHGSGYGAVSRLAEDLPGPMGRIMPGLWLIFSIDLTVLGLILAVLVARPGDAARPILAIAALCPLTAAGLQLWLIGFVPPTALLLAVGGLTLVSAMAWPRALKAAASSSSRLS